MTETKSNDVSNKMSRRKMIKGATATAVVSTGLLVACNEEKKNEQPAAMKGGASCDHTGALAVWLALTLRSQLDDDVDVKPDTWGSTKADTVAQKLADDMYMPNFKKQIESLVNSLRMITRDEMAKNPIPHTLPTTPYLFFESRQKIYEFVQQDLVQLSALYGGPGCPRVYATLQSIAKMCP